jgi:HEAT repeat protein
MFGLKLDVFEWTAVIGVAYLALRLAYGVGLVIWWYVNDSLRDTMLQFVLALITGLVVGSVTMGLLGFATDTDLDIISTVVTTAAAIVAGVIGVVGDLVLGRWLLAVSNWLMSFRVPRYREQLIHGTTAVRLGAAQRLATLDAYAIPARPELFSALKDESADVRAAAMRVIWQLRLRLRTEEDAETPRAARAVLTDSDIRVRVYAAVLLLSFCAATPEEVLPTLCEGLSADDDDVVFWATFKLCGVLRTATEPAIVPLRDSVLVRPKPNMDAIDVLGMIGAPAVPALIEILERGKLSCKCYAAHMLGNMGEAARDALPALRKTAAHRNREVSSAARQAIAKLGGEAAER